MNTFLSLRGSWTLQVSRTTRQLSITFATKTPRRHHHAFAPPTLAVPSHSIRSTRKASEAWSRSFATSSTFRQGEAQASAAQKQSNPATENSDLTSGFNDEPLILDEGSRQVDWSRSFHGLSTEAFPKEIAEILLAPVNPNDIEVKPDGIIYLPEIKYRRILNKAFGPGAWGLAPRGETIVTAKAVTREYALLAQGRLISVARGEQDYFSPEGIPTATEGCKSNALMRCCKDLGVASELWDPHFIRKFAKERIRQVWVENQSTKKKKILNMLKDGTPPWPWKITGTVKD